VALDELRDELLAMGVTAESPATLDPEAENAGPERG
jgi:hypothetical protein